MRSILFQMDTAVARDFLGKSRGEGFEAQRPEVLAVARAHGQRIRPHLAVARDQQVRNPLQGVLATRSQIRFNPILVTSVRLLGVKGNVLRVKGLDAIDGTPVLDVKPYIPRFDSVPEAMTPEWVTRG